MDFRKIVTTYFRNGLARALLVTIGVVLSGASGARGAGERFDFVAAGASPDPGATDYAVQTRFGNDSWAMIKKPEQALAIGIGPMSGLAEWWAARGGHYVRVGRISPLVSLSHGERDRDLEIVRWVSVAAENSTSGPLVLRGEVGPSDRKLATVEARLWPSREGPWISVEVTLQARERLHLRAFTSPRLLVGDGSFGEARDEGLLPGVEYLETGERSSSRLDYHTPEYLRTVPHPKKITATLMAVTHGDYLLALMWPPPEAQEGGLLAPAAGFASPNFVDGQKNHLMALFRPSVPTDVPENAWEAKAPLVLNAGERLSLRYDLVVAEKPGIHVSEAIPMWLQRYGWPVLQPLPRDYGQERALCRVAYTDVVWREEARGWNHALPASPTQWAPHPYSFNIQFLEAERGAMTPGPERDRIDRIVAQACDLRWKQLGERPGGDDYYFVGAWVLGCVEARERQVRGLIRSQRADGSWGFEPGDERRAELGPKGKAEIGIIADHAIPILRYALMTGDREAAAAGLKALENMKGYTIPRAAQVWEIPVHTPDIMGSARGATAFRLGYLLTGDRAWLDRADYWIATGLPFVYLWGHPQWPYWRYATTPVFGATHFRAPNWVGLPVQWCGLVYAEEAMRVAELTGSRLYKTVAEGILRSAMWQQPTEGEYRGLLPDSYPFAATHGSGPFINPETILRPLWLLLGYDFDVESVVVPRGQDRSLRVSAPARIEKAEVLEDGAVRVRLCAASGAPFGVLICGLKNVPARVLWRDVPLRESKQLEREKTGWQYLADRGWLVVNLIGAGKGEDLIFSAGPK